MKPEAAMRQILNRLTAMESQLTEMNEATGVKETAAKVRSSKAEAEKIIAEAKASAGDILSVARAEAEKILADAMAAAKREPSETGEG